MKGGKRVGAGRKKGLDKIKVKVSVLPETFRAWSRQALHSASLGSVLDGIFAPVKLRTEKV